ncbi:MAG: hypothetical protein MK159_04000 [Halobacteriales archaeon]|nr:hypothetical protein [Halobacteriales archaeon]
MSSKVRYLLQGSTPLVTIESNIIPQRDQWIRIHGDLYQVYHIFYDLDAESKPLTNVFVWQPDKPDADYHLHKMLTQTLNSQREAVMGYDFTEKTDEKHIEIRTFGP